MKRLAYVIASLLMIASITACSQGVAQPTATVTKTATTSPPGTTSRPTIIPSVTSAETPQYGGVFRYGSPATPRTLVPASNSVDGRFLKQAYDTLLRIDENGNLQPFLATDWKFSSDYKSLTMSLRKGVKFHDGTDLNAAAAKWNIELRRDSKMGDYTEVQSIDVLDDYSFRINLSKYQNNVLTALWYIGGMMQSPTSWQKLGRDLATWNPVGTGPFKFVRYDTNSLIKFVRNDSYWQQGKPYLDGWETVFIVDPTTLELSFRNGELHTAEQITAKALSSLAKDGYGIFNGAYATYSYLMPDTANADSPWAKKEVREAAAYAIDSGSISKALGYGFSEPISQLSPSDAYPYNSSITSRAYNVEKAKQLLTQAGYPNGFKTTMYFRTASSQEAEVAYGTNLKQVGIDATLTPVDAGLFTQTSQGGWRNGVVARSIGVYPDWLAALTTVMSATSVESKSWSRPTGFQELLDRALAAQDYAAKKTLSQQLVKMISDEMAAIPLTASRRTYPMPKNVNAHNLGFLGQWGPNKFWSPADVWISK